MSHPDCLSRSPDEWIDGVIPTFAPAAISMYDRRVGTVDIYTGIAYGSRLFGQDAAEPLYSALSSTLLATPALSRVLDIGCGPARIAFDCAPQRPSTWFASVDISREMCRRAWQILLCGRNFPMPGWAYRGRSGVVFDCAERLPNAWVAQADALDLPFHTNTFDAVCAALLLCRVRDPISALVEMLRILRPGGLLLLATPFAFNDPAQWSQLWPPARLRNLLESLGLAIESWRENIPYEEIIDDNCNSHRYNVTLCVARSSAR